MSGDSGPQLELFDRIHEFAVDAANGELTSDQWARFERLLSESDEACRLYYEYIEESHFLETVFDASAAEEPTLPIALPELSPLLTPLSPLHSPLPGYLTSGWPVAYLVATVIFGLALAVGALVNVSRPPQIAQDSRLPPDADALAGARTDRPIVGRITARVSCEGSGFSGPEVGNSAPQSTVRLGDCIALRSGLLQITYDGGAKVVLQGPVTYDVESATGGFLSRGRLTVRLEKTGEGRAERGEKAERSQPQDALTLTLSGHRPKVGRERGPAFAVRTPTAVVTDLGTEFGVEVDAAGRTSTHVFRGVVEVQPTTKDGKQHGKAVRLTANQSAQVTRQPDHARTTIRRDAIDPKCFVRGEQLSTLAEEYRLKPFQRWQAYSRELRKDPALVAYYTFESAGKDNSTLPNVSAAGSIVDGEIDGAEWVHGRWPGKFALLFHGAGTNNRVVLPEQQRFNFDGPFSIAAWFQTVPFPRDSIPSLISKGGATWRIQRYSNNTQGITIDTSFTSPDGKDFPMPQARIVVGDRRWHFVVAVIEPKKDSHRKCVYVDGRKDGEVTVPAPLLKSDKPVWLGQSPIFADRDWNGLIDEVAILSRAMPAEEVEAMFAAGNPAESQRGN